MADLYARHPIDALNLPTRTRNALVRAGITTPDDLAARGDAELLALRGFGATSLAQVRERLAARAGEQTAAPQAEPVPAAPPANGDLPGRQVLHAT